MFNIRGLLNIQGIKMQAYEAPSPKKKDALTLLFIHGLESSKETWSPVIPNLQNDYKVFAVDLRGHGDSYMEEPLKNLSIWHFVADIDRFVREKGLHQFVLVSHSMGATIAIAYAGLYPEKIRNLIIEDMEIKARSPLQLSEDEVNKLQQFNPFHMTLENVQLELKKYGYSEEKYQSWLKQGRIKWLKEQSRYFIGVNPYVKYLTYHACLVSPVAEEFFKKFREQKLPVLLIKAQQDSSVTQECLIQMQKLLPTLQVKEIPQSSHSIHKTQTYSFIQAIRAYLLT